MRQNWQLWEGGISEEQCDTFEEMCKHIELRDATVFKDKGTNPDKEIRNTEVGFIDNNNIQTTMKNYLDEANRNAFGVDAHYMPLAQYGKYSEGCFYDWHYDTNWTGETAYDRKLSICIQLSNPDDYEGGIFEFKDQAQPTKFKTRGSVLVFPSYLTHRVTEITKGERHSLVNWMEGPRWR